MKKILFVILLSFIVSASIFGNSLKIVNTSYEKDLLKSIGVNNYSFVTNENWYFSTDGIDKTAEKMLEKLPDDEPVILYGISLGGTVSRRMTQIANEKGKNVKGYIAQSSPLSGDRLTNTAWAVTSLALLGGYSTIGLQSLFWGADLEGVTEKDFLDQNYDFYTQLDSKTISIVNNLENSGSNKKIDRSNEQSVIENATLPLLNAILGNVENGRGIFDYFGAVFSKGNNVKDLDPTGDFMVNIMNNSSSLENEATDEIKRAFIVSTNGNLYETSAWNYVQPVLNYYQNLRNAYWSNAKSQWWLFAYWALRAAVTSTSIATIEGVPRVWSICVSGSFDYSTNDGFVPADDTFQGKKLQMIAPNMRNSNHDLYFICENVSHLDYGANFEKLPNIQGRSYSRKKSVEQQKEALKKSYTFINK